MDDGSRQQRAGDLDGDLRTPHYEEKARMGWRLLPYALASLILQCLSLLVGVRTVRQMYRDRHRGGLALLRVATSGPLLGLYVLNLADWLVARRLRNWVKHANATRFG